jgi:hypothetical protein
VLWQMCTEPTHMAAWQADVVRGRVAEGETLSLKWPALRVELGLKVEKLTCGQSVVFSHGRLATEFVIHDGRLEVRVTGVAPGDASEGTLSSWELSLATLEHYLRHHLNRPRRATWLLRRSKTKARVAHTFFTDEAALRAWLSRDTRGIGAAGSDYFLELGAGSTLDGRVLSNISGRDVLLSVQDWGHSACAFRTLPSPYADDERIIAITWSEWGESAALPQQGELLALLEAALDRLGGLLSRAGSA